MLTLVCLALFAAVAGIVRIVVVVAAVVERGLVVAGLGSYTSFLEIVVAIVAGFASY